MALVLDQDAINSQLEHRNVLVRFKTKQNNEKKNKNRLNNFFDKVVLFLLLLWFCKLLATRQAAVQLRKFGSYARNAS